jgi:hypothetical protein
MGNLHTHTPMAEPDECNDCMDYVQMISDGKAWICVCCGMEEATFYVGKREGVFLWHRYQLRCGHQCHERCYRRWCLTQDGIGCPTCGLIKKSQENEFCRYCDQWGHPRLACPRLRLASY